MAQLEKKGKEKGKEGALIGNGGGGGGVGPERLERVGHY
jgi:hypothetical protein